MAEPVALRAAAARRWRLAARVSRAAVLGVVLVLAFIGAAVSSPAITLIWAPGIGAVAAGAATVMNPEHPMTAEGRRTTWFVGWAGALAVPATSGLGVLGDAAAPVVIALLLLTAFWFVESIAELPETSAGAAARRDLANLRRVIDDLSVDGLLREWQLTATRLREDLPPEARLITAQARDLIVDELTRRDPAGADHWLRHGGGDAWRYVPGGPAGAA
jgi:hypothetical protein